MPDFGELGRIRTTLDASLETLDLDDASLELRSVVGGWRCRRGGSVAAAVEVVRFGRKALVELEIPMEGALRAGEAEFGELLGRRVLPHLHLAPAPDADRAGEWDFTLPSSTFSQTFDLGGEDGWSGAFLVLRPGEVEASMLRHAMENRLFKVLINQHPVVFRALQESSLEEVYRGSP